MKNKVKSSLFFRDVYQDMIFLNLHRRTRGEHVASTSCFFWAGIATAAISAFVLSMMWTVTWNRGPCDVDCDLCDV